MKSLSDEVYNTTFTVSHKGQSVCY